MKGLQTPARVGELVLQTKTGRFERIIGRTFVSTDEIKDSSFGTCNTLLKAVGRKPRYRSTRCSRLFAMSHLVSLLCIFTAPSSRGQTYLRISAQIEFITHKPTETNEQGASIRSIWPVICVVGTNMWRINANTKTGENEFFYDGTNLYERITFRATPAESSAIEPNVPSGIPVSSHSTVHVYESHDGCPLADAKVNLPWLAFCSGAYLKRQGRSVPLVISILRHEPDGFAYSDKTEIFDDKFGLPQSIDLFTSQSLFDKSVNRADFLGIHDANIWRKGVEGFQGGFDGIVPDGRLKFHYAASKWTNYLGWNVPLKFECFQNELTKDGNYFRQYDCVGIVTSIMDCHTPDGVLTNGADQMVVDWRFADKSTGLDSIVYQESKGEVRPTNDVTLRQRFKTSVSRRRSILGMYKGRHYLIFVLLLILPITPFAFHLVSKRRSQVH
jgi:hypothetical protein